MSNANQGTPLPTLKLPIHKLCNLQTLRLTLCHLQLATTNLTSKVQSAPGLAAIPGSLTGLTALRELKLDRCTAHLEDLSCCTALQHLNLCFGPLTLSEKNTSSCNDRPKEEAWLSATLPHLQQLLSLKLDKSYGMFDERINFAVCGAAISNLQKLQLLQLGRDIAVSDSSLQYLPSTLHTLIISAGVPICNKRTQFTVDVAQHLQQLTNLECLQLYSVDVMYPQLLLNCLGLTRLDLVGSSLPPFDYDGGLHYVELGLLSSLHQLQRLRHLDLTGTLEGCMHEARDAYSGLTASSQLTYLNLTACHCQHEAVEAIFAANQPCRSLAELHIPYQMLQAEGSCLLLLGCCHALQHLNILYKEDEGIAKISQQPVSRSSSAQNRY